MTRFVLDASVALAWVVDRNADPFAEQVQLSIESGARAVVPALWQLEIANVLAKVARRGLLNSEEVEEGLAYLERFLAKLAEVASYFPSMREILRFAQELQLTSYDAVYIDLALREKLPLATLDKGLRAAAKKAGVDLVK